MPKYKESSFSGSAWQRCRTVTIQNPYMEQPAVWFQEEEIVELPGGKTVARDTGSCHKSFVATDVIPIVNPETGAPTGATMTHGELYAVLYSLYMQAAGERDAA